MPNTRHGSGSYGGDGQKTIPFAEAGSSTQPAWIETRPWVPTVSEAEDPIDFGMQVFAHRRMPDGTRLSKEEQRFIAAIIMDEIGGEK